MMFYKENNRWADKKVSFFFFGFLSFIFLGFCLKNNVYAAIKPEESLYKLSVLKGAERCYYEYANRTIEGLNPSIEKVLKWDNTDFSTSSSSEVWIPTHVGNTLSDNNDADSDLSCKQVFAGYGGKAKGIFGSDNNLSGGFYTMSVLDSYEKYGYVRAKIESSVGGEGGTYYATIKGKDGSISINNQVTSIKTKGNGITCEVYINSAGAITEPICSEGTVTMSFSDPDSKKYDIVLEYKGNSFMINGKQVLVLSRVAEFAQASCIKKGQEMSFSQVVKEGCLLFNHATTDGMGSTTFVETPIFIQSLRNDLLESVKDAVKGGVEYLDDEGQFIELVDADNSKEGYEIIKQDNKYVAKLSAKILLNNLGIDSNLPTTKLVAKNLTNIDGGELTYYRYVWSNPFIYSLYYYYLYNLSPDKGGKITLGGPNDGDCAESPSGGGYWFRNALEHNDEHPRWCKVNGYEDYLGDTYSVYDSSSDSLKKGNFGQVLQWLSDNEENGSYKGLGQDDYANLKKNDNGYLVFSSAEVEQPTTTDQGENASGTAAATCQSSGGAGAVGWIVCPILEWMGNSATHLYTDYVEPRLKINPKLFQTLESGNENPTQNAWGTFQTIANVVFIILLLVVIFSQLTGIGIDNYGIKRILPKLIVVAILVNLSYLICVICVDLSNILGGSLKGLFDSLGASLGDIAVDTGVASTPVLGNDSWIPVVLFGILVTFIIVGAASIVFNPAILLTLLISGLGVVVSVLFIFVLFAVREAAIVVLTVVAPIAFVCYALPNTKKMFDKWLKAWEGLLLVYPICGLLIGGGDYISRLLITVEGAGTNETGFFPLMTAMVVGIAPIFFIPSLLKGSFAAMGNIGAKVSGIGKTLGGKATGRLANSGVNKRLQQRGSERRTRVQAGVDRDGNIGELGRFGRFVRGGRHNIASSRAQYLSNQKTRNRENSLMGGGFAAGIAGIEDETRLQASRERTTLAMNQYRDMGAGEMQHEWEDAFRSGDTNRLDAITNVMNSRFGTTAANLIGQSLSGMNGVATNANYQASLRSLQQTMNDNSAFANNMKNKASDAFQMISDAGMHYDAAMGTRTYEDLSYFSANNPVSTDIKDWSTQSTATLQRAIVSGKLDNDMIQQILNSKDPSIQSGIQSDAGKRNLLQGQLYRSQNPAAAAGMSDDDAAQAYRDSTASAADWSGRSTADLQAAISSGTLSDDMVQNIVNSSDENVRTNLLNDPNKRDMLQAHVWNQQHGPAIGPPLNDAMAAERFRNAQNAPTIRSSGAYSDTATGTVVQLNEMSDGSFVNAADGSPVDITKYRRH